MNVELERLKIRAKERREELDKISSDIRELESILKDACITKEKVYIVDSFLNVHWCTESKRLMAGWEGNMRPLLEQPIEARVTAHGKLKEIIKFLIQII